jgi:uncharacterized protein YbjT (DUF2867 family)
MKQNSIALIGASGLIGSHILEFLLKDDRYGHIKLLVRSPMRVDHPKVEVLLVDFADHAAVRDALKGSDALFCAVGTTTKKVKGNKDAYRKVDYDIPVDTARLALKIGYRQFLFVSSVGARSNHNNFYLKLKGEAEEAIGALGYPSFEIFRPSLLLGHRKESRPAERIAQWFLPLFSFLLPQKLKPIAAKEVAKAMVLVAGRELTGTHLYHYKEMKQVISKS